MIIFKSKSASFHGFFGLTNLNESKNPILIALIKLYICVVIPSEVIWSSKMSCARNNFQFFNNPLAIRQEIQRFESVHPSIYAIYDLIELIPDQQIAQQIRDHVVCIEGKTNTQNPIKLCIYITFVSFCILLLLYSTLFDYITCARVYLHHTTDYKFTLSYSQFSFESIVVVIVI